MFFGAQLARVARSNGGWRSRALDSCNKDIPFTPGVKRAPVGPEILCLGEHKMRVPETAVP
jgi:hypothetical protein